MTLFFLLRSICICLFGIPQSYNWKYYIIILNALMMTQQIQNM